MTNHAELAAELVAALGDKPTTDPSGAAVDLIKTLATHGASLRFIAEALRRACIKTATGKTHWDSKTVHRIAKRHGVEVIGYGRAA